MPRKPPADIPSYIDERIREADAQTAEVLEREVFPERHAYHAAQKGNMKAAQEFYEWMDKHPEKWRVVGDQVLGVRERILDALHDEHLVDKESTRRYVNAMVGELTRSKDTPLMRLAAERVALDWLYLAILEHASLAVIESAIKGDGTAITQKMSNCQKWVNSAHRRFMDALKMMSSVESASEPKTLIQINDYSATLSDGWGRI